MYTFFLYTYPRINDGRKKWINIIKRLQPLPTNKRLFVCDLHFNSNDIRKSASHTSLKKDALPCVRYLNDNKCMMNNTR